MKKVAALFYEAHPRQNRAAFLLFLVLSFVLYGSTLKNRYAIDDEYVTVTNAAFSEVPNHPAVAKGFAGIPEIFASGFVNDQGKEFGYRPMAVASYAIEYQFFGSNPVVSHLINVLLYVLLCYVLFLVLKQTFPDVSPLFALLVALLFLIHPLHSEIVNNLKSRDELFALLGGFVALRQLLLYFEGGKWYKLIGVALAIAFALFSKPTALLFAGVIPLMVMFRYPKAWKKVAVGAGVLFAGAVLFALMRKNLVGVMDGKNLRFYENPVFFTEALSDRFTLGAYTMGWYFKQLLLPVKMVSYYGAHTLPVPGWGNPIVWVSLVFHIALGVVAVLRWKNRSAFALGALLYLGTVFAFSNIMAPAVGIVADRFAVLPSLGFCMMAGSVLWWWTTEKRTLKWPAQKGKVLALLMLVFTGAAIVVINMRNAEWADKETLFTADVAKEPQSIKLHALLGDALMDGTSAFYILKKKLSSGERLTNEETIAYNNAVKRSVYHYRQAIALHPDYKAILNNLGSVYLEYTPKTDSAIYFLNRAHQIDSTYFATVYNLAVAHHLKKEYDQAIMMYEKAEALHPDQEDYTASILDVYMDKKAWEEALLLIDGHPDMELYLDAMFAEFGEKEQSDKTSFAAQLHAREIYHPKFTQYLINQYLALEDTARSIEVANRFLDHRADSKLSQFLSQVYLQRQHYDLALNTNLKAAEAHPEMHVFVMTIGDIYYRAFNDFPSAKPYYEKAHSRSPNDKKLCGYLAQIFAQNGYNQEAAAYQQCANSPH